MADYKIKRTQTGWGSTTETTLEVNGADYISEGLLETLFGKKTVLKQRAATEQPEAEIHCYNMRAIRHQHITPDILKAAINEENLDGLLHPFDEIDIPLDTGGTVTVVCGYVEPKWARFVLKDCWDEAVMNEENTNKTGYFKSRGRAHVLTDILPHIEPEWRAIFKPRQMVEIINGERVEYADLMWLPSATDVFGPSEDGYWKDEGDNFQLPIFEKERDRVKECGDNGTYPYWLRSVHASSTTNFRRVTASGRNFTNYAYLSLGYAPGFDI